MKKKPEYDYSLNMGSDIYGQFFWQHYFLPWHSKFSITLAEYDNICKKKLEDDQYSIDICIKEGKQVHCPLWEKGIRSSLKEEGEKTT